MRTITTRLSADLDEICKIGGGFDENNGFTGVSRIAYSPAENKAHEFFANRVRELGLEYRVDAAGNSYGLLRGKSASKIVMGSHLDSVPKGGNYDGGLGVVMSLAAIEQLRSSKPTHSLEVVAWRCEESARFNVSCVGSKLATGYMTFEKLADAKDKSDISLHEAMRSSGANPDRQMEIWSPNDVAHYIEPHIEQWNILSDNNIAIGVVTGIRAPVRYIVNIVGEEGHSGATPMKDRKDALVSAAQMIATVYDLARTYETKGKETVATVGYMNVRDGAISRVPGEVEFALDIRGTNLVDRNALEEEVKSNFEHIARSTGVKVYFKETERGIPVVLAEQDRAFVMNSAVDLGIETMLLPSGAGHDAQYVRNMGISTSMIFVRNNGGSHNPRESIKIADAILGTKVLVQTVRNIDRGYVGRLWPAIAASHYS